MEQLVARWAHNPKVAGSSPAPATRKRSLSKDSGLFAFGYFNKLFKNCSLALIQDRWFDRAGDPGQLPLQEKGHYRKMVAFLRFWRKEK